MPYLVSAHADNRLPCTIEEITPQSEAKGKFLWQRDPLAVLRKDDLLTGLTQSPLNPISISLLHDNQALVLTGFRY